MSDALAFGLRINNYLIEAARSGREVEQVGPFTASCDPHDSNPYRNYAIPEDAAEVSANHVADLVRWFRERDRKPRLEFVPAGSPAVEAQLLNSAFTVEARLPVMVPQPLESGVKACPEGFEVFRLRSGDDLKSVATAQNVAYGGSEATDADVARLQRTIEDGGEVVAARNTGTGAVIGAGLYTIPHRGVTEIAGVGVVPAYRRRGIAAAITAELAASAAEQEIELPFLMAADAPEERIYRRIGFETCASILHISLP